MFLFPFIYILFFLLALRNLAIDKMKGIVLFIIFGLPIYTLSLSICNMYGFPKIVPYLQSFKEICIVCYLTYMVLNLRKKIQFHTIDKVMIFFFFYILLYVFIPLGSYGFFERVLAFKSLCFFPLVYFTGRLIDLKKISLSEIFHYICLLSILAACVLLFEVLTYTHIQTYTGYADYNYYFFGQEPSGDYGLTWTFQIENGMKRFASFFSAPLEYAAATLISVSALAALITNDRNKLKVDNFSIVAIASSLFAICFALSRASFASYFVIIYAYAWITHNRIILKIFHYGLLASVVFFLFVTIKGDFFQFILNTVQFTNESSVGHVIEWLNGVDSMVKHPLGIGLGESGRISAFSGDNTGGENQFIILGVQVGVIALGVYLFMYFKLLAVAFQNIKVHKGRLRKLSLFIFLIKMGLIIPLFTAEVETYIYISYLVWFLSGLLINMTSEKTSLSKNNTIPGGIVCS